MTPSQPQRAPQPCRIDWHWTNLILVAGLLMVGWHNGYDALGYARATLLVVLAGSCAFLHELAHVAVARLWQVEAKSITILPVGAVTRLGQLPPNPLAELGISLAGPLVSLALAAVCLLGMVAVGDGVLFLKLPYSFYALSLPAQLFWFNLAMGVINLIPCLPLDGGKIFRNLLQLAGCSDGNALILVTGFSVLVGAIILVSGMVGGSFLAIAAGLFLGVGAVKEFLDRGEGPAIHPDDHFSLEAWQKADHDY